MLRSILAIVGGYLAMVLVVMVSMPIGMLAAGMPFEQPSPDSALPTTYLVINVVFGYLAGLAGGFVAGLIPQRARARHVQMLAALILVLGVAYAIGGGGAPQPEWHRWTVPLIGTAGVLTALALPQFRRAAGE